MNGIKGEFWPTIRVHIHLTAILNVTTIGINDRNHTSTLNYD